MKKTLVTAHSGCEGTPRDSMESIERALEFGADVIEMDIRRASDGRLYISHDRLPDEESVNKNSLEDVFRRIQNTHLCINCDIKEPFAICDTMALAKKFGLGPDRLFLTGAVLPELIAIEPSITENATVFVNIEEALKPFSMREFFADKTEELFPELANDPKAYVMEMMLDEDCVKAVIKMVKSMGLDGINMPHKVYTPATAAIYAANGIRASVWTPNEPDDVNRCLALGAYNITTRSPSTVTECRRKFEQEHQ